MENEASLAHSCGQKKGNSRCQKLCVCVCVLVSARDNYRCCARAQHVQKAVFCTYGAKLVLYRVVHDT